MYRKLGIFTFAILYVTTIAFGAIITTGTPMQDAVDVEYRKAIAESSLIAQQLEAKHTALFNRVWRNPNATASQILTKYGTDCQKLFEVSSTIQTVLATVNPAYVPLVPLKPVTFSDNGACAVGE